MYLNARNMNGPAYDVSHINVIGSYSIDGDRRYCDDLSQLKYYKEPPNLWDVRFDLDANKNDTIYKSFQNEKLDYVLRWISKNFHLLEIENRENSKRWLEPEIVCYRGLLKTLLLTLTNKRDGWIVCASKFKGTIYLCCFDTPEKQEQESKLTPYHRACTEWGHKFEQYMLSDDPNKNPDLSVPLNQNEEFCCLFKVRFGGTTLVYGAEMDGIVSKETIRNSVVGKKLNFVELKTINCEALKNRNITDVVRRMAWWAQSYLVGIQHIVCGVRDNNGIVRKIKKFSLNEFYMWQVKQNEAKIFLGQFLKKIKTLVRKEYDQCLYKFTYNPITGKIKVDEQQPDAEPEYAFLQSWYIEQAKKHFENV